MQESDIKRIIQESEWINDAVLLCHDAPALASKVQIELSAPGHRMIRDHGMQSFEQSVNQCCPPDQTVQWSLRPNFGSVAMREIAQSDNAFPSILSHLDQSPKHHLLLKISRELDCFRGHFPGNPVLPGVVQLHWAVKVSLAVFDFSNPPMQIQRLKFRNIVVPPRVVDLAIHRTSEIDVLFEYTSLGEQHSQGKLMFSKDATC